MMHAEMSRKALPKDTAGTDRARQDHIKALTSDPRFKSLRRSDKLHIQQLLTWHNPLNGYLPYNTPALNLTRRLFTNEEQLRLSRWRLIDAGLIVSYVPGSGHTASRYCIARSWNEAEEAAALRRQPDAPHWPALVDETPSAVDHRGVPAAEDVEDQEQEETPEELADAQERLGRARRRRGVRGAVPPELPIPDRGVQRPLVEEIDRRRANIEHQSDTNERGAASVRDALRRVPTASGAA
jgi:hypothetical protein